MKTCTYARQHCICLCMYTSSIHSTNIIGHPLHVLKTEWQIKHLLSKLLVLALQERNVKIASCWLRMKIVIKEQMDNSFLMHTYFVKERHGFEFFFTTRFLPAPWSHCWNKTKCEILSYLYRSIFSWGSKFGLSLMKNCPELSVWWDENRMTTRLGICASYYGLTLWGRFYFPHFRILWGS